MNVDQTTTNMQLFSHLESELSYSLPIKEEKTSRFALCNAIKVSKIALLIANSALFVSTASVLVRESLGSSNVRILTISALLNGASVASFFQLLPYKSRKKINKLVSAWSYEAFLAGTQLQINLVADEQTQFYHLPFCWALGALRIKDILSLISLKQSDLSLSSTSPDLNALIPTVGFNTRNYSLPAKVWIMVSAITCIGLNVFNFMSPESRSIGDFGKIGMYQDLIAMLSGSVSGDILARLFDDQKEKMEARHSANITILAKTRPKSIKIMRVAKNIFVLFTPMIIGLCLGMPSFPNTLSDYCAKFTVGALYGANLLIARREFENPRSELYIRPSGISQGTSGLTLPITPEKVKAFAKKYFPTLGFFAASTAFLIWNTVIGTPRDDYAILVLFITTMVSFILTDRVAKNHPSPESNRFSNELSFRLIYAQIALSIFFQYFTTKLDLGDRELNATSNSLYGLSLLAWFFWGMVLGNNRGVNIQSEIHPMLPTSPPIVTQELTHTLANTLRA